MYKTYKLEKLIMILDIRLAVTELTLTDISESDAATIVAVGLESFLQDELGFIVKHKYSTSRNDIYMYGSDVYNIVKDIKDTFYGSLIERIPTYDTSYYTCYISLITNDLIEIEIKRISNESSDSI